MLLVLSMFANDLNLSVAFINKIQPSDEFDIYINYDDEDQVEAGRSFELIWPHYQNRYCFIYANTRKVPPEQFIYNELNVANAAAVVSFVIGLVCFYAILRAR